MSARAPLTGLRQLSRPAPEPPVDAAGGRQAAPEVCEMCSTEIAAGHGHVADLEAQRLLCTCRSCYLLFTGGGAGGGRFRSLPESTRRVADATVSEGQWDDLQIPVELCFLFRQSGADGWRACYPGPGGATESMLDLTSWAAVVTANPVLDTARTDVEAVLLRRHGGTVECWLAPIDTCYELVGLVRRDWTGFSGGSDVWEHLAEFFAGLDARSTRVDREGAELARG